MIRLPALKNKKINKELKLAVPLILIIAAAAIFLKIYFGPKAPQNASSSVRSVQVRPKPRTTVPVKSVQTPVATETQKPETATATYEYNAVGRRDPFASLLMQMATEKRKGAPPLESYDVADFRLTAILWNKSGFYALVLSPDGKNLTLRIGMTIGLHGGKIFKITTDSVIIREFLKDYRGVVRPHIFVCKLHRGEEG